MNALFGATFDHMAGGRVAPCRHVRLAPFAGWTCRPQRPPSNSVQRVNPDHRIDVPTLTHPSGPPAAPGMRDRVASHDWSATALGPASGWSHSLRTLVELMLDSGQPMFIAWGPQRIWFNNDAFVPILGRKHPQALGAPASEVWAEAWEHIGPLFDRVFAGIGVHMDDIQLMLDRRGVEEEAHFAFSYTPARDDDGSVAGLFGVCTETTAQVLAQRNLEAAKQRQRALFEQAPGFIAITHGPQHVFEFVNAAYRRLVGNRELDGKRVRDALPEIAEQGFVELLDRVYRTGQRHVDTHVRVLLQLPDGPSEVFLDYIYEPVRDELGRVTGIFVEGHDVTAAHRAQLATRWNARRQELLVELADRFRDLEDPAELSYAAAELLGRELDVSRAGYGTIDPDAETITIERDWNAPGIASLAGVLHFRDYGSYIEELKRGEAVAFADAEKDPRTRDRAGALAAISARAVMNLPITESTGLVALLYLNHAEPREWVPRELELIREVGERTRMAVERRRAERSLHELAASLERQVAERTRSLHQAESALRQSQKLEAMGQLTGGVAHDFNNLLAVVSNNLFVHQRLSPACAQSPQLAAIGRATQTGAKLTRQLLAFARRQAIRPESLHLQQELAELEHVLRVTLGSTVTLSIEVDADAPPVLVDRSEFELAILNLAVNANDAMAGGGQLSIRVRRFVADGAEAASIEVSDTGHGIAPELLPRLFEPFFSTKGPGRGTGLGLSQVYGFATQAGGTVEVSSVPGKSTTVRIVLPASRVEAGVATDTQVPADDHARIAARVLLVEDNLEVGTTTRELLQFSGCEVLHYTSGDQALAYLQAQPQAPIDLVLSDLVMPGEMGGVALAEWLRRERPTLPVLLTTGYSADMQQAQELGFTVLQKPVTPEVLMSMLRGMLS